MFGLLTWKAKLIGAGILILVFVGMGIALKVAWLQKEAMELRLSQAEQALDDQKKVTDAFKTQLQAEIEKIGKIESEVTNLSGAYADHQVEISNLQQKFVKHNLKKLSAEKPKLIEKILNKATKQSIEDLNSIGSFQ